MERVTCVNKLSTPTEHGIINIIIFAVSQGNSSTFCNIKQVSLFARFTELLVTRRGLVEALNIKLARSQAINMYW